jgi:hypothetical protein
MPVSPSRAQSLPLGGTVGIEFETENISPGEVSGLGGSWEGTHDASIEMDTSRCRTGFPLRNSGFLGKLGDRHVMGVELVSGVYNLDQESPEEDIHTLTKWLSERCEPAQSFRAGIHVHVGLPSYNLDFLKSYVAWGSHLEALFFMIGGMGYRFRGELNDSAFCRPITGNGPLVVPHGRRLVKCFDSSDLMNAKSIGDFWYRYGNSSWTSSPTRYVPQRYVWLNFYSILAHHTLEFRVFNKTLNPAYILAIVELCQKFTVNAIKSSEYPTQIMSAFDVRNIGKPALLRRLESLGEAWRLSPRTVKVLSDIINRTPEVTLDDRLVYSHLSSAGIFDPTNESYTPRSVDSDDVFRANVVTIHSLRGESR